MWEIQAGKFTTSKKAKIDFRPPEFSATKILTCKYNIYESTNGRYYMILAKDLLTALGLDLKFSDNVIIGGKGPYEDCSAPMVEVINYGVTYITYKQLNYNNPLLTRTLTNDWNTKLQ